MATDPKSEVFQATTEPPAPKIQDYAAIGDCRSAALLSNRGSIEWLCWPRFDSAPLFAAILDRGRGGCWTIAPNRQLHVERQYVDETNVVRTVFAAENGSAVLTDLMPVASEEYKRLALLPDHELIRQAECRSGEVELRFDLQPRAEYGRRPVPMRAAGHLGVRMEADGAVYWLRATHPLAIADERLQATIRLRAGETAQFSLTYGEDAPMVLPPLGRPATERIQNSIAWWQAWARRAKYDGSYRAHVVRSALALKMLTYAPSGAIVAAATTSLPERVGGDLNWDYRYCWLRDASLTVRSLLGLGYWEEADAFLNWMLHATALTRPKLRILYDVFGENAPEERQLDHLHGYRDSRPVRIGNAARNQLQLDVYGEVMDAAAQYAQHGGVFDRSTQKILIDFGNYIGTHWFEPDEGIWEPRGGRAPHTHSRLLCWTALDRLLHLSSKGVVQHVPVEKFQREREKIFKNIKQNGWNERLRTYTSVLNGDSVDASLLLMPWYGFEAAGSERMQSTYQQIRKQLGTTNGLLYRYLAQPAEGAFGICGFWEAEYFAIGGGSLEDARRLFERLCAFRNDIGLFAEEVDPGTGDALGNFPQAFTHVGLISAALSLQARKENRRPLRHRAETAEEAH
ncbi:MAG TPA: glycoside hydrolase family 15 protein [Terriglobales bacterium]|nr:glycoside hydrolase family 15 protein [Terriglobales bacterium]